MYNKLHLKTGDNQTKEDANHDDNCAAQYRIWNTDEERGKLAKYAKQHV